jgi:signal transduction histidine kinase
MLVAVECTTAPLTGYADCMRVLKPYGIALLATFAALVLRGAADPWLNDTYPLLTLFPAVGAAVYFGGVRPAIVTTALGYLGVNYWFIAPRGAFGFGSSGDFVALLAYISSCALIIAFGGALLSAKRRAEVAETTLTGQARELREADRRKDDFLAILAHELRNPLAPIRNSVTLLKVTGAADPHVVRARDIIDRQVAHMARLLDDLLDIGRITRNKLELRKQRIELVRIMDSALETSRPLIETSAHRLTVSLPKEPIYLDADPVRLSQAFANLLNNAAKYTDAGGHIELSAHCERKTLSVEVKDNGIGIAANELGARIRVVFTRLAFAAFGRRPRHRTLPRPRHRGNAWRKCYGGKRWTRERQHVHDKTAHCGADYCTAAVAHE